jgi:hypothetical protein
MGAFLRTAPLPLRTVEAAISFVAREQADFGMILDRVAALGRAALDTSYEKENAGLLAMRLLEKTQDEHRVIESLNFPPGSLEGRLLGDVEFVGCRFQATAIGPTSTWKVVFRECYFERIELTSEDTLEGVTIDRCDISSLFALDRDESYFGPDEISDVLRKMHAIDVSEPNGTAKTAAEVDEETRIAEQALRAFMRATHLNENVFKQRLGQNVNQFFDSILPALLEEEVLQEVQYKGGSVQRRFKLSAPMRNIEPAIRKATDLSSFIALLKESK